MIDYIENKEALAEVMALNEKIASDNEKGELSGRERTRLLYEQMLKGCKLQLGQNESGMW